VGLGRSEEARSFPDFAKNRAGDSGARGVKEEGSRESFEERATRLHSGASARGSTRPRKWSATVKAGACGPWLAGPRYGDVSGDQRNWHRLVPVSSGAQALLACEDRSLEGCARVS
jgi:hypothetical protein